MTDKEFTFSVKSKQKKILGNMQDSQFENTQSAQLLDEIHTT
jgi:hypothetical protein